MSDITVEWVMQVWSDKTGCRVEIGPDSDSLGLIEMRSVDGNGKITARLTFTPEEWEHLRNYPVKEDDNATTR